MRIELLRLPRPRRDGATYDAVVSVEMIEAVGHEFWGTYFQTIDRVLAPGGRVAIQAITMPHDRMLATRGTHTWITKYIFPGGFLPSTEVIDQVTRDETALRLTGRLSMGSHYAETLRRWDETFLARRDDGAGARLRRPLHADLALLPRLLARRLRQRLHRRPAARPSAGRPDDHDRRPRPPDGDRDRAHRLAEAARPFLAGDLPVRLQAWDGSVAGPEDAPLVVLRSPDALRRLLWHPGELGAAQAYVTGELDVPEQDGWDLDSALTHAFAVGAERGLSGPRLSPRALVDALRTAAGLGVLGRPPAPPASQARIKGRLHTLGRDRSAISHHYDLSNEFYSLILEPQMAYSCGYHATADTPLEEAQRAKLDLVCTKLGLEPGMRMLDVGCGWGSLSLHAAEHFGAQVTGVTIAAEQKKFIDARIAERGLQDRVEIRLQDYREVPERDHFDAVGSLEMGEHVGQANYPTYVEALRRAVRPGGRVLVQQMSRQGRNGGKHPGGGPFIESFIAPDMHMRPVGETVAHDRGRRPRGARRARACASTTCSPSPAWLERFEAHLPRLTELVGEEVVRVWRLYLVGGAMAFRDGRMGVDQILAVRPGAPHTLPAVRAW